MTQSERALGTRGFSLIILILLVLTDLAILLDIPVLRPVSGFLFFTIVPGLLILHILRLNQLDLTERLVFAVGLSVAFNMFAGLVINSIYPLLGYARPLSTIPVVVSFSFVLIIFIIVGYLRNRRFSFALSGFALNTREKAFLVLPALLPLVSILGMNLMNRTGNNVVLTVMLLLIPAYAITIAILHSRVPQRTYPAMIFLIGISVILLMALRTSHILGSDTHGEYYYFQLVASNQHWQMTGRTLLNSCLSISLLPAIYQSLMSVNQEYLFKILYPLLFSVSPLIIYNTSRKYIGDFYAFLASFFFVSQLDFIWATVHARTITAILFFALIIAALFNGNMANPARKLLAIIFAASCIVSHYSTTYIAFLTLLLTWIGMMILFRLTVNKKGPAPLSGNPVKGGHSSSPSEGLGTIRENAPNSGNTASVSTNRRMNPGVTITFVVLFLAMLFLWYAYVAPSAFSAGVGYTHRTLTNLSQVFVFETRGTAVSEAFGQTLAYSEVPASIKFAVSWLTISGIAVGVLATIVGCRKMVALPGTVPSTISLLKSRIDAEYWVLSLACCAILVLSVVLPYALHGYGMSREYLQMMTVLAVFFIIGILLAGRWLKSKAYWLILVILIPYFMCNTGTVDRICGVPGAVTLTTHGPSYDFYYIYDQEGYAGRWLRDNSSPVDRVIYADRGGWVRLVSQGGIPQPVSTPDVNTNEYIYLTRNNLVNNKLMFSNGIYDLAAWQDKFAGKGKVYANGVSEIYR